jgi:maltose O-acetyltransferase
MKEQSKIYESRLSKKMYALKVLRSMFSLTFIKHLSMLFAFYVFNYVRGRRLAHIGRKCHISQTVLMRYPERIFIGDNCLLNHNNILQAGKKTGVIRLGDYVMVGPNVQMFAYNHCMNISDVPMIEQPYIDADIIIEDDVWIGAGTTILGGAKINKGVVVGAGSVVTGELLSNSICVGVPAKVIKMRE